MSPEKTLCWNFLDEKAWRHHHGHHCPCFGCRRRAPPEKPLVIDVPRWYRDYVHMLGFAWELDIEAVEFASKCARERRFG